MNKLQHIKPNPKLLQPRGKPGVSKWDRALFRLEGASVGCAGCINSQPTRPSDET